MTEPSRPPSRPVPWQGSRQGPARSVVAHPHTLAGRRGRGSDASADLGADARAVAGRADRVRELDEQTALGLVLVRSLVRAQLGLALRIAAMFAFVLGGLPLVFAVLPSLRHARVFGIELPWLVLGLLVYPLFIAGSWAYVRLAERNERDFVEMVERT